MFTTIHTQNCFCCSHSHSISVYRHPCYFELLNEFRVAYIRSIRSTHSHRARYTTKIACDFWKQQTHTLTTEIMKEEEEKTHITDWELCTRAIVFNFSTDEVKENRALVFILYIHRIQSKQIHNSLTPYTRIWHGTNLRDEIGVRTKAKIHIVILYTLCISEQEDSNAILCATRFHHNIYFVPTLYFYILVSKQRTAKSFRVSFFFSIGWRVYCWRHRFTMTVAAAAAVHAFQ